MVAPSAAARLLLTVAVAVVVTAQETQETQASQSTEFIICRKCGTDIADSYYLYNQRSPNSEIYPNLTLFGRPEIDLQVLKNPLGVQFKIINTSKALCSGIGEWVSGHTWFPGFLWKFCVCPHCSVHLGWIFEPISSAKPERVKPSKKGFYALIFDNVVGENYIHSLMIAPKILRS